MKRFLTTLFLVVITIVICAQPANDNTLKFLGHPVDGDKSLMEVHLKRKGFKYNEHYDCYKGKFNGKRVEVYISTNNQKIDRVYVSFPETSENLIRYEYNNLIRQFNDNGKYMSLSENVEITEDEDISYEMTVKNKRYEAAFYLKLDTLAIRQEILTNCTEEQKEILANTDFNNLENLSSEDFNKIKFIIIKLIGKLSESLTGEVWFTIHENYGKYQIGLYYDNLNNRPNGEDL